MAIIKENTQEFGDFLSDLRTNSGYKASELVEMLNIHRDTLTKWERGKSVPDIITLKKLSLFFDTPLDVFLNTIYSPEAIETSLEPSAEIDSEKTFEKKNEFLKSMSHEQRESFLFAMLMIVILLISKVFAPLNLIVCLGSLIFMIKKALHSGWLYFMIPFFVIYDIYVISGWFL